MGIFEDTYDQSNLKELFQERARGGGGLLEGGEPTPGVKYQLDGGGVESSLLCATGNNVILLSESSSGD